MRIVKRDPNLGYIDGWFWLPKSHVKQGIIKRGLVIPIFKGGQLEHMRLWRESPNHVGIPRARLSPSDFNFEVVDLTPSKFEEMEFKSNIVLDKLLPHKSEQREAYHDMINAKGGILNLACGKGKTVICLKCIADWREPALVICNTNSLMHQWKRSALDENLLNLEEEQIGWVQGNPKVWSWENKHVVFASLKTLAIYADQIPPEMRIRFGRIIWDEIHHLSATDYCKTADVFLGKRYGATATPKRADGTEFAYYWHVGNELHTNLKQDIIPTVIFKRVPTTINLSHKEVVDKNGKIHHRKLAAYVGLLDEEIKIAKSVVDEGLKRGKEIVAISMSKDHVIKLHEETPNSGVLHAFVKEDDRLRMLNDYKITYGTVDMLSEGLDKSTLDSLIILTEFRSSKNIQQSTGRIQRLLLDRKKKAKVIVLFHVNIPPLKKLGLGLMKYFKESGFKVKVQ